MKTRKLKTKHDYEEACARIYLLMHSSDSDIVPGSPEGKEIEFLSVLIEKYEKDN